VYYCLSGDCWTGDETRTKQGTSHSRTAGWIWALPIPCEPCVVSWLGTHARAQMSTARVPSVFTPSLRLCVWRRRWARWVSPSPCMHCMPFTLLRGAGRPGAAALARSTVPPGTRTAALLRAYVHVRTSGKHMYSHSGLDGRSANRGATPSCRARSGWAVCLRSRPGRSPFRAGWPAGTTG
jgi:hypothetical protein